MKRARAKYRYYYWGSHESADVHAMATFKEVPPAPCTRRMYQKLHRQRLEGGELEGLWHTEHQV